MVVRTAGSVRGGAPASVTPPNQPHLIAGMSPSDAPRAACGARPRPSAP